jgi:hypothetical protein
MRQSQESRRDSSAHSSHPPAESDTAACLSCSAEGLLGTLAIRCPPGEPVSTASRTQLVGFSTPQRDGWCVAMKQTAGTVQEAAVSRDRSCDARRADSESADEVLTSHDSLSDSEQCHCRSSHCRSSRECRSGALRVPPRLRRARA